MCLSAGICFESFDVSSMCCERTVVNVTVCSVKIDGSLDFLWRTEFVHEKCGMTEDAAKMGMEAAETVMEAKTVFEAAKKAEMVALTVGEDQGKTPQCLGQG